MYTVAILVISQPVFEGQKEDRSGQIIRERLGYSPFQITAQEVIPPDSARIREKMLSFSDDLKVNLLLTSGGTGLGPHDRTPEITLDLIDREIPGIPEAMRAAYVPENPKAMLSRTRAGIRKETLIINLPGSSQGVAESLDVLLKILPRALGTMQKKDV